MRFLRRLIVRRHQMMRPVERSPMKTKETTRHLEHDVVVAGDEEGHDKSVEPADEVVDALEVVARRRPPHNARVLVRSFD